MLPGIAIHFGVFFFITFIALMLFVFWVFTTGLRGMVWGTRFLLGAPRPPVPGAFRQCTRVRCAAFNPGHAQYCRRCGAPLGGQVTDYHDRTAA